MDFGGGGELGGAGDCGDFTGCEGDGGEEPSVGVLTRELKLESYSVVTSGLSEEGLRDKNRPAQVDAVIRRNQK